MAQLDQVSASIGELRAQMTAVQGSMARIELALEERIKPLEKDVSSLKKWRDRGAAIVAGVAIGGGAIGAKAAAVIQGVALALR